MATLAVLVALFGAGALVTLIGARLIERAHPPRGRFVDVGGRRQHIVELGAGRRADAPPLVLIHGAGCNLEDMRIALGERLAACRRVILIDRPGQGWSERSGRSSNSPAAQAAVLRRVLDRLHIDRAILIGHSWGGTLAAAFALDHPGRVGGLVLLAPPTHPHLQRLARLYAVLAAPILGWLLARTVVPPMAAAAFGAGVRLAFRPQQPPSQYIKRSAALLLLRPATFLANARDVAGLQAFLAGQAARYGALTTPSFVFAGDRDAVVSSQHHAVLLAAAAPAAKLIVLPGLGHMLHHFACERIIAAVDELSADG